MSKFTPGKWEVETHGISVFDERCEQTLFITDNVYSWADNNNEAEANARLIAAAPEMYRLVREFAGLPAGECMIGPMIHEARRLIACIDGEEGITAHEGTE